MLKFFAVFLVLFFVSATPVEASVLALPKPKLEVEIAFVPKEINFQPLTVKRAVPVLGGSIDIDGLFSKYSGEYGVDKGLLMKIADCESHFHTTSVNGDYGGMFQFSTGTWQGTRAQMGLDQNPDLRFSGEESIRTAAFKISRGGTGAWANCAK